MSTPPRFTAPIIANSSIRAKEKAARGGGLVPAFTIIIASQFTVGALLSHFGLLGAVVRPLELSRLVGMGILLVGIWLIIR